MGRNFISIMDNRKDRTKRSCGFNEYSWSSDDEETDGPLDLARRQTNQLPITGELLGNNSETPSPSSPLSNSPARRATKLDRDMFWSLINRPTRLTSLRSRLFESTSQPSSYVSRLSTTASPPERRESRPERSLSADVQRIIAFKRLTKNMNAMRPNKPGSSYPIYSSRSAGPSRNPLFSQAIAAPVPMTTRTNAAKNPKRLQTTRPVLCFNRAGGFAISSAPIAGPGGSSEPRASTSGVSRTTHGEATGSRPGNLEDTYSLDQSDDDAGAPSTSGLKMAKSRDGRENMEIHEGTGGAAAEDEVVEVDPPDEPSREVPPAPPRTDAVDGGSMARTVNASEPELAGSTQQARESKRKRDGSEERNEPITVKEFNLSLLRLLECPVCLEWMEPPIAQCRRGHLVCSRCRERLAACPVCRTSFSSVRNRAMEGVAELLRYPCRHGCGREVRLRRRSPHEASCGARKYQCPAPPCEAREPLAHADLAVHFQSRHLDMLKMGRKHTFSLKVTTEHHDDWLIMALQEYFHLRVDIDVHSWGIIIYVAYIGPKCNAKNFTYEITIIGQHNARKLVYARSTHSDLESSSVNVSRQDCFHLTLDQALNFLRFKNRHCDPDKYLDFNVEITKNEQVDETKESSET